MDEEYGPDWRNQIAIGGEALQREIQALIQSAQLSTASFGRPIANRITRALSAALTELLVPGQPVNVDLPVARVTITAYPLVPVIGTGSVQLPPMSVRGYGTVTGKAEGRRVESPEVGLGRIVACVLLVFGIAGLLSVPADDQAAVGYYLGVISLALTIAFQLWNTRK